MSEIPDTLGNPNCLLRSLHSQNLSLGDLEVIFRKFTLNVCHILEPGIVINIPGQEQLLTNKSSTAEMSVSYCGGISSKACSVRPVVLSGAEVVVSHHFQSRQNWIMQLRNMEPGLRRLRKCPLSISQE
ncbi:hypothetical protein F5B17DRAFT_425657 [Nemania serpens]|nr:hypothetical protein F5B17DRAFT_425657 [Nemania serpens]